MSLRLVTVACLLLSVSAFAKKPPKAESTVLEAPEFAAQPDGSSDVIFMLHGAPAQPNLQAQGGQWLLQFGSPVSLGVQAKRPLLTEAFGGALQSVRITHAKKNVVVTFAISAGKVPTLSAETPSADTLRVRVHVPAAAAPSPAPAKE